MFRLSSTRFRIIILFGILYPLNAGAQKIQKGVVTYISTKHIYLRFKSTEGIELGDSLWRGGIPELQILKKTSISVITQPLSSETKAAKNDTFIHINNRITQTDKTDSQDSVIRDGKNQSFLFSKGKTNSANIPSEKENAVWDWGGIVGWSSRVNTTFASVANRSNLRQFGRFNLYGNSSTKIPIQLNLNGNYQHYNHAFSDESNYPQAGRVNLYEARVGMDVTEKLNIQLGRGFQRNLNSIGVIDGLNINYLSNGFHVGGLFGFAPNPVNYSFDLNRPIYGGRIGKQWDGKKITTQLNISWLEQKFNGLTDKRYVSSQGYINAKKLNVFYLVEGDVTQGFNNPRIHSLYTSFNLRLTKKWSLFNSFDKRLPLINWESMDQISVSALLNQTDQYGWRSRVRYQVNRNLSTGLFFTLRATNQQRQMLLTGINVYQSRFLWRGSSASYRMSIADYGIWQNAQQTVRLDQRIGGSHLGFYYRSNLFTRRFNTKSIFNQSYMGLQTRFPLPKRYEMSVFTEYSLQQQQNQLLLYLTLNKRL